MADQHPWDEAQSETPEPGSVPDEHGFYERELPGAAPFTELPEDDADHDEDMS